MKPWWKWRPTLAYRVPRCVVRVDGGPEHAPVGEWRICGKKVSWACGMWMNDPGAPAGRRADEAFKLWQTLIPLCAEHKNPSEKPVEPRPYSLWDSSVGLRLQLWKGLGFGIIIAPLSWEWWGWYETDPKAIFFGPICIRF